jgi:hypothetical protein
MPTGLSILHVIALAPTADAVKVLAPVAVLVVVHAMGVPAIGASGLALAVCVEPPLILCGGLVKFAHGVSFSPVWGFLFSVSLSVYSVNIIEMEGKF